jgi:hypothetical protein
MKRMKPTRKLLMAMAREEAKTAKFYRRLGFKRFASDEARHAFVFAKLAKRRIR